MCKKHLNGKCCQSDGEFFGLCDMLESRGLLLLRKKKQVRLSTVSVALCILACISVSSIITGHDPSGYIAK